MMKRKSIILATAFTIFTLGASFMGSMAWFMNTVTLSNIDMNGDSKGAYFAYGNGTSESPFGISTPRHLYNLAWLQYNGDFNKDVKNNSTGDEGADGILDKQYYFEVDPSLTGSLDMTGWTLPPIGTETYPFLGSFNGNNKTITNLTVSNPSTFSQNQKPISINYNDQTHERPEIVGFFGVVGNYPNLGYSFTSSVVSVNNITLNNINIKSSTTNTLVGLAAGYLDSTGGLSNIKIAGNNTSIDITGSKPIKEITGNFSDYSLIGYCSDTGEVSNYTKKLFANVHKETKGQIVGGFKGSIDFKDINDWIFGIHTSKGYSTAGGKVADVGFMEPYDDRSNWSGYNTKSGTNYELKFNTVNKPGNPSALFHFSRLVNNSSSPYYLDYTFNITKKLDNNAGYSGVYTETRGTGAYGGVQTLTFSMGNKQTNSGQNNQAYYLFTFEEPVSALGNVTSFYLYQAASGGTGYVALKSSITFPNANPNVPANRLWGINSFYYIDVAAYRMIDGCYFPLQFNNDKSGTPSLVTDDQGNQYNPNTGYIVGKSLAGTNYGNGSPKISSYSKTNYLNNSITDDAIKQNGIKYYNGSGWATITDTKDANGVVTASTPAFEMYVGSRNVMKNLVDDVEKIHGLHFDSTGGNGDLNTTASNIFTASSAATTMSTNATSYAFPKGSIDFYLKESGYISFFAGTYTDTANAPFNFFSLYKIERPTSNGNITFSSISTIKEVKAVYKASDWTADDPTYVYQYVGDNSAPSGNKGLAYDLSPLWCTNSELSNSDHSLYYFEIPIGQGEFALGPVNSTHSQSNNVQGAYMMYLDIGSNGKSLGTNTMDAFYTETSKNSESYPQGVDFNITSLPSVGGSTACLQIGYSDLENMTTTVTGKVDFAVTSSVSMKSTITNCNIVYKKDASVVSTTGSSQTIGDLSGSGGGISSRILRATINDSSGANWVIEYDDLKSSYTKILKGGVDKTSQGSSIVPDIFKTNITTIKEASMSVQLEFRGTDFSITSVSYSNTTITLSIPPDELGSTSLTVTFGGTYDSLYINGDEYPTS